MINREAKNNLAKLLSTEDITVQYRNSRTASFNIKSRVLSLPYMNTEDEDILDLFIGHEVSHALNTPLSLLKNIKSAMYLKPYINVIEDVRIEKLIKNKYMSFRGIMKRGYTKLYKLDAFGINNKDIQTLALIDRINLHFKIGHLIQVPFLKEELDFVKRADKISGPIAVKTLAKDIFYYDRKRREEALKKKEEALAKEEAKEEQQEEGDTDEDITDGDRSDANDNSEGSSEDGSCDDTSEDSGSDESSSGSSEDEDGNDYDEDSESDGFDDDDGLSWGEGDGAKGDEEGGGEGEAEDGTEGGEGEGDESEEGSGQNKSQEIIVPEEGGFTDEATESFFENETAANQTIDDLYITEINDAVSKLIILPYKEGLEINQQSFNAKLHWDEFQSNKEKDEEYIEFNANINNIASMLHREFEAKKAAYLYSHTNMDQKSGRIDSSKLHEYKIADDIFKRIGITTNVKNHGLILYLDFSLSMMASQKIACKILNGKVNKDYVGNRLSLILQNVIGIAKFCRMSQIPFKVYTFSIAGSIYDYNLLKVDSLHKIENSIRVANLTLIERFTSEMPQSDFNKMRDIIYLKVERRITMNKTLFMNGTPTLEAVFVLPYVIKAFQKKHAVQKLNFILITDGDPTIPLVYFSEGKKGRLTPRPPHNVNMITTICGKRVNTLDTHPKDYNNTPMLIAGSLKVIKEQMNLNSMNCFFINESEKSEKDHLTRLNHLYKTNHKIDEKFISNIGPWDNYYIFGLEDFIQKHDTKDVQQDFIKKYEVKKTQRAFAKSIIENIS